MECKNHLTHTFAFDELEVGKGSNEQPYFRALIFFYKKPGLTDEFFHEHWKSVHADLTMSAGNAGINLTRYVQFHQDASQKELMSVLESLDMKPVSYDGCAEFHAKDASHFVKFMANIRNSKELVGCGSRFTDTDNGMHIMVGYDNLILGSEINTSGGSSGILPSDPRLTIAGTQEGSGADGVER